MIPQNLFPARKKAPQKMARPVPVYMEVTPPRVIMSITFDPRKSFTVAHRI